MRHPVNDPASPAAAGHGREPHRESTPSLQISRMALSDFGPNRRGPPCADQAAARLTHDVPLDKFLKFWCAMLEGSRCESGQWTGKLEKPHDIAGVPRGLRLRVIAWRRKELRSATHGRPTIHLVGAVFSGALRHVSVHSKLSSRPRARPEEGGVAQPEGGTGE